MSTTPAAPPSTLALGLLHLLKHLRPFEARGYLQEAAGALDDAERGLLRRQLVANVADTAPAAPPSLVPPVPTSTAEILASALPRRRWGVWALVAAAVALCGTGAAILVERPRPACPEVIAAEPCPAPAPVAPSVEPAPLAPPPERVRRQEEGSRRSRRAARAVDPFDSRF